MSDAAQAVPAKRTAVVFRCGELARPVLLVEERYGGGDVFVFLRARADEHLSLHREVDGSTLFTIWSPDKPRSVWDDARVNVARRLGHGDPERHAHYYVHRRLYGPAVGEDVEMLVGWAVRITAASRRAKYERMASLEVVAPAEECMVRVLLRTSGDTSEPGVATAFGTLHFRFDEDHIATRAATRRSRARASH